MGVSSLKAIRKPWKASSICWRISGVSSGAPPPFCASSCALRGSTRALVKRTVFPSSTTLKLTRIFNPWSSAPASISWTPGGRVFSNLAFSAAKSSAGDFCPFFEARKSCLALAISAGVGSPFTPAISRCMRSIMRAMGSKLTVIVKPAVPERSFCRESVCSTSKQPTRRAATRARPGRAHRRIVFMAGSFAGGAGGRGPAKRLGWAQSIPVCPSAGAGRSLARMPRGRTRSWPVRVPPETSSPRSPASSSRVWASSCRGGSARRSSISCSGSSSGSSCSAGWLTSGRRSRPPATRDRSGLLRLLAQDRLHPSHLAIGEADLDAVRVAGRGGEDVPHDPPGTLAGPLILFEDDLDGEAGAEVLALAAVHDGILYRQDLFQGRPGAARGGSETTAGSPGTLSGASGTTSGGPGTSSGASGTTSGGSGTLFGASGTISGGPGTLSGASGTISGGPGTLFGASGTIFGGPGTLFGASGTIFGGPGTLFGASGTTSGGPGTLSGASERLPEVPERFPEAPVTPALAAPPGAYRSTGCRA